MKKLESKHIIPYLSFGLEVLDSLNQKVKIIGIKNETYFIDNGSNYPYGDIQDCKPILKPISMLTENEIVFFGLSFMDNYKETKLITRACFYGLESLIEKHFDIFGLIEKGLAVDINTLNN